VLMVNPASCDEDGAGGSDVPVTAIYRRLASRAAERTSSAVEGRAAACRSQRRCALDAGRLDVEAGWQRLPPTCAVSVN